MATHTPIVLHSCQINSLFEDQMCENADGVIEGRQRNGGGMVWLVGRTDAIWDATDQRCTEQNMFKRVAK